MNETQSSRAAFFPQSGPVAQLGARFHGMEEVAGSIPARSTNISRMSAVYAPRLAGEVAGSIPARFTNSLV